MLVSSSLAWSQSNYQQVVTATGEGNKVYLEVNALHLQQSIDSIFSQLTPDNLGGSNDWSDVLGNGNNPGMDVNFSSYDAYGMGDLTASGTLTADSLVLGKDATIAGGLSVTGVTSLGDSLHVAGNVNMAQLLNVVGAATFQSTISVNGVTSLNDSLHVQSGVRIADGAQGAGKVLTSDANGYATWQAPASGGGTTYTAGTGVTISSGVISIGQAISTTDDVTVNQLFADSISVNEAVTVTGALTVNDTNILAIIANLQAQIDALSGGAAATPCAGESSYTYHETRYNLVELGGECWFASDLQTTNLNSGVAVQDATSNTFIDPSNPWSVPRTYEYVNVYNSNYLYD